MMKFTPYAALCVLLLPACQATVGADATRQEPLALASSLEFTPDGAKAGTCWRRDVTPAHLETVTEQIILSPAELAPDGSVIKSAVFRTETHQQIVNQRAEITFQTPCAAVMDTTFITTLQRALRVRRLYRGPINGVFDSRTVQAIRKFQRPLGMDTGILTLDAARRLGLVAIARDPS